MTDRAKDVEAIFTKALEYTSSAERRAYVEKACGGKPQLRQRILELLMAHEKTSGPLDAPPSPLVAPTIEHSHAEEVGTQIGPYKVLQVIGEGGMGIVCMAEQTLPVKRRVALKIIKPGMDSRQIIARFEAERQALAMMDHPNIARVFDAGSTDRGQPYFVMELVKGIPITEYCDLHKLAPKDRLALFIDVCQAVHHAHQKGIIHRDIKPSNVLVARFDNRPVVKVIDFGVAKATNQTLTERTMFTQFGQILGTFEYMSPEQAQFNQLDIDTRSDIYSLGVLLYELLTGQTPFDRNRLQTAALDEVLRIIREEEPPKPSVRLRSSAALSAVAEKRQLEPARLGSLIKGDLDWIVMKALEKDRTRRFGSAASFAQDVQRFLNCDPIESRPPSAGYRLRKVAWRHRVRLAMTLIAVIAVAATGLSIAFVQVSRRAEQAALYQLRQLLFDHGVTLIMNADSPGAGNIIGQLKDAKADDFADKLQAIQMLHEDKPHAAVELLERLVQRNPQDAGLRAMLTDGYDQAGDIAKCVESFRKLKVLDTDNLHPIEMVYAALAGIVEPAWGVKRAEEAVKNAPTSPYARLVRGRMTADYLHRAFDVQSDTPDAEKARSRALVDRAIGDIESLKFLYQYDRRTVALSLSTYLGAADIRRRLGDADWRDTVHLADDAVTFLEAHQPTAWEKFFLAAFYRELAQDEDVPQRVCELYREAALDDKNDYHTAYFLALCHELGRKPPDELVTRVGSANSAFFSKFGLGCWYALNGEEDKAREQVNGLDRIQTVSSVTYAVMVLHLLRDEEMAAKLIEQYANTPAGREQLTLNTGVIKDLFEFFRAELTGPPEKQQAIRDNLLLEARGSEHPVTKRFFALWAIALRTWAEGDESEALRQFQACADMRQAEFPEYVWSRAIVRRATGSGAFSSDVKR